MESLFRIENPERWGKSGIRMPGIGKGNLYCLTYGKVQRIEFGGHAGSG
jgi:hypothetical protein